MLTGPKAAFREAKLEETDFRGADLREADFTTARNLLPSQLAGADLSGSCLPADLEKFASLAHVDAATRHGQALFFIQLLVFVKYCTTWRSSQAKEREDSPFSSLPMMSWMS